MGTRSARRSRHDAQLGSRIGVRPQTIEAIEKSEAAGTIQLNTLRRAAEALDCTLVYALVPNSSLQAVVEARARKIAIRELQRVAHTMRLELKGRRMQTSKLASKPTFATSSLNAISGTKHDGSLPRA